MKNLIKKSWNILVITLISLFIVSHVSCGVTKTTEKCDKDKKECCSKK